MTTTDTATPAEHDALVAAWIAGGERAVCDVITEAALEAAEAERPAEYSLAHVVELLTVAMTTDSTTAARHAEHVADRLTSPDAPGWAESQSVIDRLCRHAVDHLPL